MLAVFAAACAPALQSSITWMNVLARPCCRPGRQACKCNLHASSSTSKRQWNGMPARVPCVMMAQGGCSGGPAEKAIYGSIHNHAPEGMGKTRKGVDAEVPRRLCTFDQHSLILAAFLGGRIGCLAKFACRGHSPVALCCPNLPLRIGTNLCCKHSQA